MFLINTQRNTIATAGATIHAESFVIMPRPMQSAMGRILISVGFFAHLSVHSIASNIKNVVRISLL